MHVIGLPGCPEAARESTESSSAVAVWRISGESDAGERDRFHALDPGELPSLTATQPVTITGLLFDVLVLTMEAWIIRQSKHHRAGAFNAPHGQSINIYMARSKASLRSPTSRRPLQIRLPGGYTKDRGRLQRTCIIATVKE